LTGRPNEGDRDRRKAVSDGLATPPQVALALQQDAALTCRTSGNEQLLQRSEARRWI